MGQSDRARRRRVKLEWVGDGQVDISGRTFTFRSPGTGMVRAGKAVSNPITCFAEPPRYKKYWGDLHAQSDATVGTGTEEEYFRFARDIAHLDFCSHQGNDFQVRDEDWKKLNDAVRAFHKDHAFVVFPGWEWSGNSTVGGDRNVWYLEEDMPIFRSSHWQVDEPENELSPADTAADLFARVAAICRAKKFCSARTWAGGLRTFANFLMQSLGRSSSSSVAGAFSNGCCGMPSTITTSSA